MNEGKIMLVLLMTLVSLSISDGLSVWPQPMPMPTRFKDGSDGPFNIQLFIPYLRRQPWGCEIPRQTTINRLIFGENKAIYARRPNKMPKPEKCTCAPDTIGFRPVEARVAMMLRQQNNALPMPSLPVEQYIPYLRVRAGCPLPPRANTINRLIYKENQAIYERNLHPWNKPDVLPEENCTCIEDEDSLPYPPDLGYPDIGFGLGASEPASTTTTTTTKAPQVIILMPTRPSRVRPPIRPHVNPNSIGWRWREMINRRKHNSWLNGHSLAGNGEEGGDENNDDPQIFRLLKRAN